MIEEKNIMIKAKNMGMKFNLGIEKGLSIKQFFIDLLKGKRKNKIKNEFWALDDINFEVKTGEVIGLIGSNGAGKSTLLKIVAGVMKPTKGEIKVNGNVCPMIELGAGFDYDLLGYSKDFIDKKFNDIVEFSELSNFLEVPVKNFSSGMIARLAFSIATIVDPEVLIVDEILSVGDLAFQQKSEEKMKSMICGGTTVLYVSHSIESIESLCDRVIWLEHGRIVEIGNPTDVCKKYQKMVLKEEI